MDSIRNAITEISRMKFRQLLMQFIVLGTVVSSALMMWKGLMLITNCESPIVVVLTGSMEPSFYRGDILFINWDYTPPSPGDIVVYKVPSQEIPIVHRVIALQPMDNGEYQALTKGDNNPVNDRGLYERGELWLGKKHIFGRIRMFVPYVGVATIILNDYPMLKWGILIIMGIFVLTSKDPNEN
jgi:signal peptidase